MPNPKDLRDLHRQLVSDGIIDMGYKQFESIATAKGKEGVQNRQDLHNIAREGGYFNGDYKSFSKYFVPVNPQKKEQQKQQIRQATGRQAPAQQRPAQPQKPAATPQGQKPKPVQQSKATPVKPDSVVQQYMPTVDPTQGNGKQSRVRPQQGTGVLKTDAQIMRDDSLSAEDKVALINDNRRRRGQRQRTFNGPAYEEAARDMGVVVDNPVEGFTESVESGFQPDPFFTDTEGEVLGYKPNYVNKSPVTEYNDRIKEIADEINYYNTKQDQGGGGTTRIEDAINDAYAQFVQADDERMNGSIWNRVARAASQAEDGGIQDAIERGTLREKYAGVDAVAEAAYQSFPDEIKQKYGEDAVRNAVYQATLETMQENVRPKNFGQYLAQKLTSTVPAILYKAAVKANTGGATTLSDIADMETAKYEEELGKRGFVGQVMQGVGTGVSFIADPTMYIPFGGPASNLVGRGLATVAAKRAVGRGLEAGAVKLASKAAGSKIVSRGLAHGVSGGVQMAAYEEALGLANMANGSGQNFWDVTGEALETGAIMVPLGFVSQGARVVKGRTATAIADKGLSRGAQWAANTGAKLGINTTAFIAEAGIFASPDLIKMAVNGTYTNEQARDVVNHSIASLAGIKVAGAFNPTHIQQTMQQVRSIVKGTMGTELALNRHDAEALRRLGYGEIQGDNIMNLFVPLGERPEAKNGGGYFSQYSQIVLDERVPWSTRAKLIYIATGKLPETGVRPNQVRITTDENGRTVVTTLQGNNPISQRFFSKQHKASAESYYRKASHDVERMNYEGTKQDIYNEYLGGMFKSKLVNDALAKNPKDRTPEEQKLVDDYNHEVWVAEDLMAGYARRTVMYDDKLPDPEKALKKPEWERSDAEKQAVQRYGERLNKTLHDILRDNYADMAADLAWRDATEAADEMSNKRDGQLYQCQLRGEEGVWYTVVDFDGTIEQGETGMDVTPGPNGDKMMVRNMGTGEVKMVTLSELTTLSTDRYSEVRNSLGETMYNNYTEEFIRNRRKVLAYGKQPQNAEVGQRLTLAADEPDANGLRPEYVVVDKDANSGTYIVEDAQGNRRMINGHDIQQLIGEARPQIPESFGPQAPPQGPQTPPPAAPQGQQPSTQEPPAQEQPVQPQGEAPAMPEQGDVFKLKVGDEFIDAEVTGKDDTGIIVRYEQNGMFRTEHLTPEELAPRLEQPEAPAAPQVQGEGGAPAAPVADDGIPRDENGKPIYHRADQKTVEDYFKSKGLEDDDVMPIADAQIRNAQKDLDDATAKRDKGRQDGDPDATAEAIAAQKDAQERLDWWNKFKEGYGKEEEPAGEGTQRIGNASIDDVNYGPSAKNMKGTLRAVQNGDEVTFEIDGKRQQITIKDSDWVTSDEVIEETENGRYDRTVGLSEGRLEELQDLGIDKSTPFHAKRLFKGRDGKWYAEGFFNTEVGPVDQIVELSPNFDINEALRETKERRAQKYAEKQGRGGEQPPVQESEPDIPQDEPRNMNIPNAPVPEKVPDATTPEGKEAAAAANAKRYNEAEKLEGYRVQITLPNGEKVIARYKVVPHDVVVPSHDPFNGYRSTPGYAEDSDGKNVNDRDYSDRNYQFENEKKAQNYDGRAVTEPPVVNSGDRYGGSVLGGNDRTMAGQLAAVRGTDIAYLDALDYNINQYGISRRALREFMERNPHARLVLEVEGEMPMETETMAKFNQSGMKSSGTTQSTNKVRRLLTEKEINQLRDIIGANTDKTFGDLSRSPSVAAGILRVLKEAGIILENEQAEFLKSNGTLSKKGEALLQEIVRASILDERGIKALDTASDDYNLADIEQRIDQITPSLVRNAALGEFSLREEISRAIEHIRKTYESWANGKKRGLKGSKKDALVAAANSTGGNIEFGTKTEEEIASEQTSRILSLVFGTFSKEDAIKFFNEYERMANEAAQRAKEPGGGLFNDLPSDRMGVLKDLAKKYGLKIKDNGPEQREQGQEAEPGETETPGGNGSGDQGNGRPAGRSGQSGEGTGRGEGPVTPPQEPQGGGEPPKSEGEPPKPEEPGKPAGEGPATAGVPQSGEPHQLTVDEINGLNLGKTTKERAIDYVNGDRGMPARVAYSLALKEWERINGKSGEGKAETPPTTPEDNGPQEPPKGGGGGTSGRGGGKPSTPRSSGRKPAEPKPAEPKPDGEGPKNSGDIDLGGLDELSGFEGLFGKSESNENRRPSREGEISNEARYIPEEATEEQNRAVEKVIDVLADIGKQCLEKKGMRTQSELVDFMRQTEAIRKALDRIGFDEEDKSNLYNDMWGARVNTPKGSGLPERMRLSEYAEALSKTDKPKQDDKPKQIISPVAPTVKNVVYKPKSKGKTNESIIPASMAQAVSKALGKINGGDTDGFVLDKCGFKDKDELYEALNAEQIDGVALAIAAIERGEGLILGDMTGIGKGRQLAAVMRYARKEGIRPVFVTEKPGLFKDMMRDLLDVGADTPNKPFRPLIIASADNGDVTLSDGSTVKAADAKTIEKLLSGDLDKLAKGYDALFVTYANTNNVAPDAFFADQNAVKKEKTHNEKTETKEPPELTKKKLNLIAKWARGSIVVMDEAHNAAGTDSNQAVQWREIIDTTSGVGAKGVVMASATYAKTPKNYVLYALRTPIKEAHLSNSQLLATFTKGGVPLQEWLASQLTGESYIRRERDMTGVNFDYRICVDGYDAEHPENSTPEALEKVKAIRKSNDKAANIANIMLALDNKASDAFKKIKEVLVPGKGQKGGSVSVLVQQADGTYKEETINAANYPEPLKMTNSTFSAKIAAVNAQLFMAEKAESAADAAIKAIEDGEMPMIVFENTFDALMKDLPVDENGVLKSADYAQAFVRYLEQLGNFTIKLPKKNANGAQEILKCRINLSGDPDFALAKRMIETEGVGLHVSPVDRIRERLEEAGYKVGELSGREFSIQKLPDGKYHKVKRKTENPDKVTDDYNTGKIDVLLINGSGSTGRSMHEKGTWSEDGKTKIPGTTQSGEPMMMKPRHQIYVQNFNNETTMVQAMGRIDRTGQVEHGRYTFLMTPVPAETNILMRAQRKREQLKANTTAQQDRNSFDAVNASDFINKYGDQVVAEYLENNPKIANALQIPLKVVRDGTGKATPGLAKKATANAYTLTCDQQQEFYDDVQAAYDEYVKVLKENGDYDLETQVVDLQAETLAEHMFVRGSHESDSMFSQDTSISRCRVKVQRKPMKVEEIEQHIKEVTGAENSYEYEEKFQEKFDKHFADMEAEVEKEFEAKEKNVDNDGKKNDKLGKIRAFKAEAQRLVKDFPLDLLMPFYSDASEVNDAQGRITTESMPHAIVYDIKLGRTLGSSTIVFAVNDGRQKVAVRMNDDAAFRYLRRLQIMPGEKFDRSEWNKSQGDAYEDAFIITGNLIGAYHSPIAQRGRMIRYTDSEGNQHTGILMPRNFKTKDVQVEKPISEFFNQLMQFARLRHSSKDSLPVFAGGQLEVNNTRYNNEFYFTAKGELAKRIEGDPELEIYRTGKTTHSYKVYNYQKGDNSIQKVLSILAGRYGVSASVPIDPAYFMTKEERAAEAEARMFRVEPNIEEMENYTFFPGRRGKAYIVHVPKERMKNVDASSDWYDNIIRELNGKGLYGDTDKRTTNESGKRVYKEFAFQNKAMAEEFVRMVNEEPVRPLAIDEKAESAEPNWEEVNRSEHTYRFAAPEAQLTGDDIAKDFGFRGVDTGNTSAEGVRDLHNAFMTMAMILNIDPRSLSLGGNMDVNMLGTDAASREFGPGVTAHFRVSGETSSYTGRTQKKMQFRAGESAFPLAHEWFHALDNYFGTFGLKNEETGFYEQTRHATENADKEGRPWTAREEMREAFNGILRSLVESGFYGRLENEHFFKNTNFTDSSNRPKYWGKHTEMLARAFEAYMRKKIAENEDNLRIAGMDRMLDMVSDGGDITSGEFDPTPKEQAVIDKAFDKFFETIKERRDPDTGRVIMYEQAKPGETKREATMRETRNLNRVLAKTGLANSVTVESETDFAKGVLANTGKPLRDLNGVVYGYTDAEGNIHINAAHLNFETPIHEYGHLWNEWAKKNHGDLWQRGIELAKESDAFKRLKQEAQNEGSVYNGMTDDQLADEVLADAIGKKGQSMYDPKDWTRTARVKNWFTQLWHRIGEALGFRKRLPDMAVGDMSFDDIIRTAAGDILSGKRMKGARGRGRVNFASKGSVPTFYSNAAKAVENVKQNKATAEQWKAMLTKAGGIKAGEDKWMGLSEWLDEHKGQTLTKEEVAQFVADNGIRMEEVNYGENIKPASIEVIPETVDTKYTGYAEYTFPDYPEYTLKTRYEYPYGDVYDLYRNGERIAKSLYGKYKAVPIVEENARNESGTYPINEMRDRHTTNGLSNKREIVFTVPDVGPYEKDDFVHFGPENKGHQIMWVRFGETTDTEGNRVLVIDEVQSNRHQAARKVIGEDENGKPIRRGYKETYPKAEIDKQRDHINSIIDEINRRNDGKGEVNVRELGVAHEEGLVTDEEYKLLSDEIKKLGEMIRSNNAPGIPAAPFETNWHEVAMKRMLRLAAEEGFDKVAWTTGEQQAKRYDLSSQISGIEVRRDLVDGLTGEPEYHKYGIWTYDNHGNVILTASGEMNPERIVELFGKDLGNRILATEEGKKQTIMGEGLTIGGEGMKGFYDQMLPQFMNKYGKKWGVKVGEVELNTPGKEVMHSVDVTPEMRESVITQGQPLFHARNRGETRPAGLRGEVYTETREDGTLDRKIWRGSDGTTYATWFDTEGRKKDEILYYPNGEVKAVRNYDSDGAVTRELYYDENRRLTRHWEPRIGTDWKLGEDGVARGTSNGVELTPYNFRFQQAPANNPAGSTQGNNEQLHIARDYAQDRTRRTTRIMEEVVENSISLRHVLEDIARKSGKPIEDYENVYLAENQSHGMMTTELITFRDRRVRPLEDALRKLAKNYGGEPTKNYVWARHGIERSIYICFRDRAYELAEKEAEAAARARGEEVTDKDINDAYNAMLDELYNATSGYSRRDYLEALETECRNILTAHGDTEPFEVTDKAGLTALNDKRSLVDDKPIENAWEIVKEYENNAGAEGEADVEALFDRLNDISKSMLDYSRDKGMMDKATAEKIRKMFRFYVPLQGFAEGTMAQDYFEYMDSNPMRAGRAVPNTPKMRGRSSESADPIATLVRNAEMTIAAARRNTVATHLYNLATSRDTDLFVPARAWEAYDAAEDTWVPSTPDFTGCETTKDMMDAIRLHDEQMRQQRELGLAREARRGFSNRLITAQGAPKGLRMSQRQRHEHAVPVRINGKENVIYVLSDPRIAQIVNGTDKGRVDKENAPFFYQANRLKRIQSGLMTSYNIAFWFANGARDIQNAFIRQAIMNSGSAAARTALQGAKGDPLGVIPWEALTLYNKAVKGTLDESNKHERYFKEFFEHGGITGYAFADQVERIQSRVKKLLEHPKTNPRRLMFAVGELMEKAGGAFEIAPRFATYVASRDGGKSIMQAVSDAKESTVNFDRRGARRTWAMRAAAAFYAFLNPGIQGMQNRLHQVRTNPGKTTLLHAAGFVMGYLWKGAAVACLMALGRKDDEYDTQLTEYDRRNNICIPVGDDDWVKIPINMEDRVLFGLGDAVRNGADFFEGNRYIGGEGKDEYAENDDWLKYAGIVSAWFPIDVGSENNFIPTSLQPIYDLYINKKDFRGNAVDWRNDYNSQLPEYQRANPYVTSKTMTDISKWWSEANGGDEVTRAQNKSLHGWDEINPQHMQYLLQSYLGGLGTTIGQVVSLAETIGSDDDDVKYSSFKFPIANRFWKGNLNEYSSTKDERKKARIWANWAEEVTRRDREYRKRGAGTENSTLGPDAQANYEDNLRYLDLAKEIKKLARKKSTAKSKATKEGRTLDKEEERELDNAFWENIPDFEQKFLDIDGERRVPKWRKHYDDD